MGRRQRPAAGGQLHAAVGSSCCSPTGIRLLRVAFPPQDQYLELSTKVDPAARLYGAGERQSAVTFMTVGGRRCRHACTLLMDVSRRASSPSLPKLLRLTSLRSATPIPTCCGPAKAPSRRRWPTATATGRLCWCRSKVRLGLQARAGVNSCAVAGRPALPARQPAAQTSLLPPFPAWQTAPRGACCC